MASTKYCLTHPMVLADAFCRKCHRPVCSDCVIVEENETFCSNLCVTEYKMFKAAYKNTKLHQPSFFKRLIKFGIILLFLAILAVVGIHYGKEQVPALKPYDYFGKYLDKFLP